MAWRHKEVDQEWFSETVANVSQFVISGVPIFAAYEIKVQAQNDYGSAPEPESTTGYSGEDCELIPALFIMKIAYIYPISICQTRE